MAFPLLLGETVELGFLQSDVLQDHVLNEIGGFQLDVTINVKDFLASTDKQGFAKHAIARHLAGAVAHTGVPAEKWFFFCDADFAESLNLPPFMAFQK